MARPHRLVAVIGTGTDVGKTWVTARLLGELRQAGCSVAARKPAQSFEPSDDPASYDAAILGAASGEEPETVCPPQRWYEMAMAPPMAAEALGRPSFTLDALVEELRWPETPVEVGFLETAGGLRSPIADDGDCLALVVAAMPDVLLLVADAGLGTINSIRLTMDALVRLPADIIVVLNRFDAGLELHQRNLSWLRDRDGVRLFKTPGDQAEVAKLVREAD
ncbi:MAG TPA: dethiobiotin synthase [Acidimicrobiales bacterium]